MNTRRMLSTRTLSRALAVSAASLIVSLVAAESVSRLVYTQPWYDTLLEAQSGTDWKIGLWQNAFGLRDRDYATPKPVDTRRILILGDSFTYGSGVADNTATFPELLERELNAELSRPGISIEVLNGGIPGSLTTSWVELLEKLKGPFGPDLILVVFFLRDGTRLGVEGTFFGPIRERIAWRNHASFWYRNSYLYRLFRDARDRDFISRTYAQQLHRSYFGGGIDAEEWRVARANLRRIKAIGQNINASVALVVFPILAQLDDRYPFRDICELLVSFGAQNDIPTHNLLPAFIGQNAATLWVSPRNQHPNPRAHRIAADSLLPFVRGQLGAK